MEIVSPSGRTYLWDKPTPPTEADMAELQKFDAAQGPAPVPAAPTQAPAPKSAALPPNVDANGRWTGPRDPRTGMPDLRDLSQFGPALGKMADMGMESGGPALGQAAGVPLAPATFGLSIPILGFLGGMGGNAGAQLRRGGPFKFGQMIGAGVAGAIPGSPLAGAPARAVLREGGKLAAGNLIAKTVETGVDEQRMPTMTEGMGSLGGAALGAGASRFIAAVPQLAKPSAEEALMANRNKAFYALRGEGVVLPPSEMGRGSDTLSSIAGKAATGQQASQMNQQAWNRLAREEVGMAGALPITVKSEPGKISDLDRIRQSAYEPYETIKEISQNAQIKLAELKKKSFTAMGGHELAVQKADPTVKAAMDPLITQAAADVDALKVARFKAQSYYDSFKAGNPKAYEAWQAAKGRVDELTDNIAAAAQSIGDEDLVKRLNSSRTLIAKTYALQKATNPSTGLVDPASLGAQLLDGEPLTGNLKKIADFQLAFHRAAVDAGRVPAPGVNNLSAQISTAIASQGNPSGLASAFINAMGPKPARSFLLSNAYQNSMTQPRYTPTAEEITAMLARFGSQNAGRQVGR